jgi:hypothetical protein
MKDISKKAKFLGLVAPVYAQNTVDLQPQGTNWSNLFDLEISQIISATIILVLVIAAVIFFFILVVGGVRWIMSGGDKANTEAARGQITSALIGLVIVFSAWAIMAAIGYFFGIDIFQFEVPSVTNF